MASVKSFEELEVWKTSRVMVRGVYAITQGTTFNKDYNLQNQIRRAAVSTMSNIAEGFGRNSNKEFIQFLHISLGSVNEVKSLLFVILDLEFLKNQQTENLFKLIEQISKMLNSLIIYLKRNIKK